MVPIGTVCPRVVFSGILRDFPESRLSLGATDESRRTQSAIANLEKRRLMCDGSSYRSSNFGNHDHYINAGDYGTPGDHGSIGAVGGYSNVEANWMR